MQTFFSAFIVYAGLDILESVLRNEGWKYLVLIDSTPVDMRLSLVDEFTEGKSIPVFYCPLKLGVSNSVLSASVVLDTAKV